MQFLRRPRFKRAQHVAAMQLTERDLQIIRLVHRHRFLRSSHVLALIGDSPQQLLRRLQLLFHHGYLERPRAQIDYYHRGGSRHIVYGIGSKGAALMKREHGQGFRPFQWSEKNRAVGRLFLEHALLVSDVMVALEIACRQTDRVRLITGEQLSVSDETGNDKEPFQWNVSVSSRLKLGIIPDRVFALEFTDQPADRNRAFFFLEADRATMPVIRHSLSLSSFYRKLLAYEATWTQGLHRSQFGFHRFRVVTVTTSKGRVKSFLDATSQLERGRGLFLFADLPQFASHPNALAFPFLTAQSGKTSTLLD